MDEKTMIKNLGILADYFLQVAIAERDKDIDLSFKCYQCSDMLKEVAERITPAEAEIEGGGSSWFYVCGECHGAINPKDKYCRHCGRPVEWTEEKL